ncbi:HAD-IA family hydrolase [Chitiniphilus purpureus]|uniref:HAD-IA family hydrolase n=1 Tax=Chitiniphilus purpureus TaxID=2981137 RepID=A0ABY6DLG4_9NEIS|nr:HAD-IA family hydrolase [Chitiniphilus sp. CD1]UXY14543.1 HAD-IA family hydrolase [Chitiniphilus sp. CD1]
MPLIHAAALLFDMDGTLIDSHQAVEHVWAVWCERRGLDLQAVLRVCHGTRTEDTVRLVAPQLDVAAEVAWLEALEAEVVDGQMALPGAAALLAQLPASRWAVATSAALPVARMRFAHCRLPLPEVLVTSEMVVQGKPAPDPYLLAARRLGVDPAQCVVFEDAPAGLASALAAGCRVILVGNHAPAQPGVIGRIADYRAVHWQPAGDGVGLSLSEAGCCAGVVG